VTGDVREVTTAAGRKHLAEAIRLHREYAEEHDEPIAYPTAMRDIILAIEAEAAAAERARIREAVAKESDGDRTSEWDRAWEDAIQQVLRVIDRAALLDPEPRDEGAVIAPPP
jgi:hypothetical protein